MTVLDAPALPQLVIDQAATAARVPADIAAEALRLAVLGGPDVEVPGWQDDAFCKGVPADAFYPERGSGWRDAVAACSRCDVQSACLAYAISMGEREGIWGGTTQNGRARLRKVLREAGVLGVTGEDAYLAWVGDGADREPVEASAVGRAGVFSPRPHQQAAVDAVHSAIADGGACQIAMATASGKTHVGLWAAERLEARRVLVLVPNLALVAQTVELWAAAGATQYRMVAVCSDTGELDLPTTTDPADVRAAAAEPGPLAVFATYQSSSVLAAAGIRFDLVVADEAHHLAGEADKAFAAVVRGEIPTDRTLYMTATPRRFHRKRGDVDLVSMDDPVFGPRVYELNLADAVAAGIVADYRVIVAAVDRHTFDRVARHPDLHDVDPHLLAGAIAVVRTMGAEQLASCVSFHTRIDRARTFAGLVGAVAEALPGDTPAAPGWAGFLHGGASVRIRQRLLQRLVDDRTWGIVANAKTLGEGVDVPTLDAIAIVDPKTSDQDVMQAVGRALRRPGADAKVGTVLLPVLLAGDVDPADPLAGVDERSLDVVAGVLRALRGHDPDLSSRLDRARRTFGKRAASDDDQVDEVFLARRAMQRRAARGLLRSRIELHVPGGATGDLAGALALHVIRESTAAWEEAYGRLLDWIADTGELPPQESAKVPDATGTFSLGAWCTVQRSRRRRGILEPDRVERLDAIPEWRWEPRDEQWWSKLEVFRAFVVEHGRMPTQFEQWRGVKVGNFLWGCRAGYSPTSKENGWLRKFPDRIAALEAIPGFVWSERDAAWDEHYDQLKRWARATGSAFASAGDLVDGFDVGKWSTKQRGKIRRGELDGEKHDRLRALPGWVDEVRETGGWTSTFDENVQIVATWMAEHDDTVPPISLVLDSGFHIGSWCNKARSTKRTGQMPADRVAALEAIPGWQWELRTTQALAVRWNTMLKGLKQYVVDGGDPERIPEDVLVEGVRLGNWVISQRMEHRRSRLSEKRVAELEQIPGWTWEGHIGAKRGAA